jgi:hypothetical protein
LTSNSSSLPCFLATLAFFGYLCWERQRNTVEIKLPSVSIEK